MSQSNREQTQEQFSPGTTADGNRLDKAMRDIVAFWNAIPKRNRQKRYVQTQLVGGFNMGLGEDRQLPFMSVANTQYFYNSDDRRNEWRYKGTRNNYIDPSTATPANDRIVVWGPKIAMPKGAILDGIFVALDHDGQAAVPPACATVDSDLTVIVDVDDRWTPDIRRQSLVQYLFNRLDLRAFWSLNDALPAPVYANTMLPPHYPSLVRAFNAFWGFALEERGLGIAVPELARVRLGIAIPKYNLGAHGWSATPWADGNWSWALTFLEEVQ